MEVIGHTATLSDAFQITDTDNFNSAPLSIEATAYTKVQFPWDMNAYGIEINCKILSYNESFNSISNASLYFSNKQLYFDPNFVQSIENQLLNIFRLHVGSNKQFSIRACIPTEQINKFFTNILETRPLNSFVLPSGWYQESNLIQYALPINSHTKISIENNYAGYYDMLTPFTFNYQYVNKSPLLSHFSKIKNCDIRRFLFLYLHYCYMSSWFTPISKDCVVVFDTTPQLKEYLLSFLFGSYQRTYERIFEYTDSGSIKFIYHNTKDIPFVIDINPKLTASKAETILDSIFPEMPMIHGAPSLSFSVPVVFSGHQFCFDDYIHLEILPEDIDAPLDSLESVLSLYKYFSLLAQYISNIHSPYLYQSVYRNTQTAEINNEPHLFAVFRTLNELLKGYYNDTCNAGKETADLYHKYFDEDIDDYLKRFLPGLKPTHTFDTDSFYDTLKQLIDTDELHTYSRNTPDAANCVPKESLQNSPCLLSTSDKWALNAPALELIRKRMPHPLSVTTLLRQLSASHVLTFSRGNDKTYKNKIRIRYSDTTMDDQYLYEIFPRRDILLSGDIEYTFEAVKDHRHFLLGQNLNYDIPMYWNFDNVSNMNEHMLITGQSGAGKSCFLENLITQAAEQKITTVVFHHQGPPITGENIVRIDIKEELPNLLCFLQTTDNVAAVAEHLAVALHLTNDQESIVNEAYTEYLEQKNEPKYCRTPTSIQDFIYRVLDKEDKLPGITPSIRRKFRILFGEESFSEQPLDWGKYTGKVLILDFSGNSAHSTWYKCYSELYLYDLYTYQLQHSTEAEEKASLIIVSDEYQNMNVTRASMLDKILREGRKHGCALWLASQMLETTSDSRLNNILKQTAMKIFFQPGLQRSNVLADSLSLSSAERNYLREAIATLQQREFIFQLNRKTAHKCIAPDLSKEKQP